MKISHDEQEAIRMVVQAGARFGYGNLIAHLQTAWAKKLMDDGFDEHAARAGTGGDWRGYPVQMHVDLMERGEWDETGARYRPSES